MDASAAAGVHLNWSITDFCAATPREFWAHLELLRKVREEQNKA